MRKILPALGLTLANVALQVSGYQNPRLAAFLIFGAVLSWIYWIISHEGLVEWGRRRRIMTLWVAILVGALLGSASAAGWWFWQIREPNATVEKTKTPEAAAPPTIPSNPDENIVTKVKSEPEKQRANIKKPGPTVNTEQKSKGPNSSNIATYGDNSPVTVNSAVQPPPLSVSKLTYTQEQVSSVRDDAPYAVKVVVQTSVPLQPTSIAVKCDAEVADSNWRVVGSGAATDTGVGYVGEKSVYWVYFGTPVFKPETPLIILLMAKEPIKVLGVGYGPPPPGH